MGVFTSRTWTEEQVTSEKMNDIADDSQFTIADSIAAGNTTLTVVGGKLKVGTITASEMGTDSVSTNAVADGAVTFAKIATAAKATPADMVAQTSEKIVTADRVFHSPYIIKARAVVQLTPIAFDAIRPWSGWGFSSIRRQSDTTTIFWLDPDFIDLQYTVIVTPGYGGTPTTLADSPVVYSKATGTFYVKHTPDITAAAISTLEVLVCGFSTV